MGRRSQTAGSHKKIGEDEHHRLRREGPAALRWQRQVGLAEAKSRCVAIVLSGSVPFFGWTALGWSSASMLLFMAVDVVAVLFADLIRLLLAGATVRQTHAQDHRTQQMLSVVGGLEDGTGRWTDHGEGVSPPLLLGIATVLTLLSVPLGAACVEQLGLEAFESALHASGFRELAIASIVMRALGALWSTIAVRRVEERSRALYLDCGGVVGLLIGLLVLIWLPLMLGSAGVIAMLGVMYVFRIGFGLFALYWIPRVTRALERYLAAPTPA